MKKWQTIRLVLIAPLRDMNAEREIWMKSILPKLKQECRVKQIMLEVNDLHYGVGEDYDTRSIYSQELDRADIVLCFLGEHYGWVPPDSSTSLIHDEINYGILSAPEARKKNSFFYLRLMRSSLWVPTEIWPEYWEDEGTDRYEKLEGLKSSIQKSSVRVYGYEAKWDEELVPFWNPKYKGRFTGLEGLAERVCKDVLGWLETYADSLVNPDVQMYLDPAKQMADDQTAMEAYRVQNNKFFIGRAGLLQQLQETVKKEGYTLLVGDPGFGKTSILAQFDTRLRASPSGDRPTIILSHYIGVTSRSLKLQKLLESICFSLATLLGKKTNYPKDYDSLRDLFQQLVEEAAEENRLILILDNVQELSGHDSHQFFWLPVHLPSRAHVVLSMDTNTYETNFKKRFRCEAIHVPALDPAERKEFVSQNPFLSLPEDAQEKLVAKEQSGNPLYLRLALEECRIFSQQKTSGSFLETLIGLPENLSGLLTSIFQRLESKFGYDMSAKFFSILAISRWGFLKQDLQLIARKDDVPTVVWLQFCQNAQHLLLEVQHHWKLVHPQIQETAFNRYLLLDTEKMKIHQALAEFLEQQGYESIATLSELPYHLQGTKDWPRLLRLFTNLQFLENKAKAGMVADIEQDIRALLQDRSLDRKLQLAFTEPAIPGAEQPLGSLEPAGSGPTDHPEAQEQPEKPENFVLPNLDNEATLDITSDALAEPSIQSSEEPVLASPSNDLSVYILEILLKALDLDLPFLTQYPDHFFQCLWNRCYWYDAPEAAEHYHWAELKGKKLPWQSEGPKIYKLMQLWQKEKEQQGNIWLQSHRPIEPHLDSLLRTTLHSTLGISEIAYSTDGRHIVASSWDNTARIWDLQSTACIAILKGHTQWVESAMFSPNGAEVATGSRDKTIRIWDVTSGRCVKTFKGHANWVSSVCYSRDSKKLASASSDETIKIWDVGTGQCIKTFKGHKGPVTCVVFHKNNEWVASASQDNTIRIWDINTGNCLKVLKGHTEWVQEIAYSPDCSKLASASFDHTIRIWNAEPDLSMTGTISNWFKESTSLFKSTSDCLKTFSGHDNKIMSITFSHDGYRLASGSWDKTVRVWNAETGECILVLHGHEDCVTSVAFSPDGKFVASGSQDHSLKIWELESSCPVLALCAHNEAIQSLAFHPSGKQLATASEDKNAWLWDTATGLKIMEFKGHEEAIYDLAFSYDGQSLATSSQDKTIRLWRVSTGECYKTLHGHQDWVRSVAYSPDGKSLASGSNDKTLRIWNLSQGNCERTCQGHKDYIRSIAFSLDGQFIASGSADKTIRIWQRANGQCIKTLEGHTGLITELWFSKDSKEVISCTDTEVRVWEIATGTCRKSLASYQTLEIAQLLQQLYIFMDGHISSIFGQEKPLALAHYPQSLEHVRLLGQLLAGCGYGNKNDLYLLELVGKTSNL